jgi:hypothetical protein
MHAALAVATIVTAQEQCALPCHGPVCRAGQQRCSSAWGLQLCLHVAAAAVVMGARRQAKHGHQHCQTVDKGEKFR